MATPVYKYAVNEARGEVRLIIADVELVLAAELHGLSAVSSHLQCKSLNDLFIRLSDVEVSATEAAILHLTVKDKGDPIEALSKLRLKHFQACRIAFVAILSHHLDGEEGNVEAVDKAA